VWRKIPFWKAQDLPNPTKVERAMVLSVIWHDLTVKLWVRQCLALEHIGTLGSLALEISWADHHAMNQQELHAASRVLKPNRCCS
jgi:hypothetical protein